MKKLFETNIAHALSFEVGALEGELNAIIIRVEHVPLADETPKEGPSVFVLVLDRDQAADLKQQVLDALGWLNLLVPRARH